MHIMGISGNDVEKKNIPGHITGDVNDVSPVFRGRNFGANLPVLGQFACPLHMER